MLKDVKLRKKNKGFTLIEILLVVGFIALAGIGVYVVYDKVQTQNLTNQEVRNLNTIRAGIDTLYVNAPYGTVYTDLSGQMLVKAKIISEDMVSANGASLKTNLANSIVISSSFGGKSFRYIGFKKENCAPFVMSAGQDATYISLYGVVVKDIRAETIPKIPLDTATVAQTCPRATAVGAQSMLVITYK